jgi:hypothetical protein
MVQNKNKNQAYKMKNNDMNALHAIILLILKDMFQLTVDIDTWLLLYTVNSLNHVSTNIEGAVLCFS